MYIYLIETNTSVNINTWQLFIELYTKRHKRFWSRGKRILWSNPYSPSPDFTQIAYKLSSDIGIIVRRGPLAPPSRTAAAVASRISCTFDTLRALRTRRSTRRVFCFAVSAGLLSMEAIFRIELSCCVVLRATSIYIYMLNRVLVRAECVGAARFMWISKRAVRIKVYIVYTTSTMRHRTRCGER